MPIFAGEEPFPGYFDGTGIQQGGSSGGGKPIEEQPFRKRAQQSNPEFELFQRDLGALASSGGAQFLGALGLMPLLQLYGGLIPGSQGALRELLPEGVPFMAPSQVGGLRGDLSAVQRRAEQRPGRARRSRAAAVGRGPVLRGLVGSRRGDRGQRHQPPDAPCAAADAHPGTAGRATEPSSSGADRGDARG